MFKKVLIANRGAIATRIIRTLKALNIISIVVYSEADRDSRHVSTADEAYCLGAGNAAETYLNIDKLFSIAHQANAEAIHPGYGFLSENPEFVSRCEQQDIVFLGPTSEQIQSFGLKHTARDLAEQNNVPLLPGSGLLQSADDAVQSANKIGYPIMLKSTAGGGGIGMQLCSCEAELIKAFDSVKRLSAANFGNNALFLEKFIEKARHIEVQIFGDGKGHVLALNERDCSSQRRNQKVIEETPAAHLPDTTRSELKTLSRRLGQAVNYRSVGTVEYIYDQQSKDFYFLEVNTRLQVEHGVTEAIYNIDLVEWMVRLGADELPDIHTIETSLQAQGHSIQVRIYAEDPNKNFLPCAGLLSEVRFPESDKKAQLCKTATQNDSDATTSNQHTPGLSAAIRIDHWIQTGIDISAYFDPMLAKIIVHANDRPAAIRLLQDTLENTKLYGIETNIDYLSQVIDTPAFIKGQITTGFLSEFEYTTASIDVLAAGTQTTIQDYPGRTGYWHIGVPPSGPFDNYSFRLGNRLLGNPEQAAGLELTLNGPSLKFNTDTKIVLVGTQMQAKLVMPDSLQDTPLFQKEDTQSTHQGTHSFQSPKTVPNPKKDTPVNKQSGKKSECPMWQVVDIQKGQTLTIGKAGQTGARAYLLVQGGIECPKYLGSRSTFTLGQFGGHNGRSLRTGDVIKLGKKTNTLTESNLNPALVPAISNRWQLRVIYGPHGAPDFFTNNDIQVFFAVHWEVHYNSSRTGIRLIGPKPEWARESGGEAGMHPSNIHDNAYAFGAVDFTGDMPVILGPDGPSLGGFVCPATVIQADLWKLGQLKAGDKIQFVPVSIGQAVALEKAQLKTLTSLTDDQSSGKHEAHSLAAQPDYSPVIKTTNSKQQKIEITYRLCGDRFLLVEYGEQVLDIEFRFRVHALMTALTNNPKPGILELTPGIRSLQVHYNSQQISLNELLEHLTLLEQKIDQSDNLKVPSRIVHLPLSWNDKACQLAINKYMQSVRQDAPWCPSNLEFIRRINGLTSIDEVKRMVFDANYVVLGLGDVYLGAPVATPLDPRHRLVTTKYNPARTWTAENSVGIGGAYLCVYGMEGPGGYQFIGRTLQMWNRYHKTDVFQQPWLLRFFDQIRFYEVSHDELQQIRRDFPKGNYSIRIDQSEFNLNKYQQFLLDNNASIESFTDKRQKAFDQELQHWIDSGAINFSTESQVAGDEAEEQKLNDNEIAIESHIAGNVWQLLVKPGDTVKSGQVLLVLESMKMEIEISAPETGKVSSITIKEGTQVNAGQRLMIIKI